jgi:hypothetical protein
MQKTGPKQSPFFIHISIDWKSIIFSTTIAGNKNTYLYALIDTNYFQKNCKFSYLHSLHLHAVLEVVHWHVELAYAATEPTTKAITKTVVKSIAFLLFKLKFSFRIFKIYCNVCISHTLPTNLILQNLFLSVMMEHLRHYFPLTIYFN